MCNDVMIENAIKNAIECRHQSERRPASGPSKSRAMAGSPIQPRASDASVIPSWQEERNELRLLSNSNNHFPLRLPAAASVSIREERTPTSANSAATKKPFAATSSKTETSFMSVDPVEG